MSETPSGSTNAERRHITPEVVRTCSLRSPMSTWTTNLYLRVCGAWRMRLFCYDSLIKEGGGEGGERGEEENRTDKFKVCCARSLTTVLSVVHCFSLLISAVSLIFCSPLCSLFSTLCCCYSCLRFETTRAREPARASRAATATRTSLQRTAVSPLGLLGEGECTAAAAHHARPSHLSSASRHPHPHPYPCLAF